MLMWWILTRVMMHDPFTMIENMIEHVALCLAFREWISDHVSIVAPNDLVDQVTIDQFTIGTNVWCENGL